MSALPAGTAAAASLPAGPAPHRGDGGGGVWAAAWQRFRGDRVGMASLAVVVAFLALVLLAALGAVASDWQREVAVPDAPPTLLGPAPAGEAAAVLPAPGGPLLDLSDVDPLAPRYAAWDAATAKYRTQETPKAATLPLGADRLGRDVLAKAVKGAKI